MTDELADLEHFQLMIHAWCIMTFGPDVTNDVRERCQRFLEEALELTQSLGLDRAQAHKLVDYVYDRPTGEPFQEMGGTLITLAALAAGAHLNMAAAGAAERERIFRPDVQEVIQRKQAAKRKALDDCA